MKLMISVVNKQEALIAQEAHADLIDIKNPAEGSLGAQNPMVIKEIVAALDPAVLVSATVGDVPYLPCTVAQAAYAVAGLGVTYVKVGFKGARTGAEARSMAQEIERAIAPFAGVKLIAAGYADFRERGTLSPLDLVHAVRGTGVSGVLVDTLSKDGRNLFDFMSDQELTQLVTSAHECDLLCALAGSIEIQHVGRLLDIGADVSGVRGAICGGGRTGTLVPAKIEAFLSVLGSPVA